ncbi:DnaJ-domain-containing protein [Colletotrichum falcatum]|nr:DnaJ-domain-containing protein [Colletotrichum falcatum]
MQRPSSVDHYGDLGIQQSATPAQVRQAYRALALKYHPDKNAHGGTMDAGDFRRVQEAWEVLRDESKRAEYDRGYAGIRREWEDYRRWQKSVDLFETRRRAREEERRRRARATEEARRQAGARGGSRYHEATLEAARQRLRREGEELAAEMEQCRRLMESSDRWQAEVDRVLKKIEEDAARLKERHGSS